jgi:LysM repeat protein
MASHRGRHRRPSQAGKVISGVAGGGITAGIIIASTAGAAQAQPVTQAPSPVSLDLARAVAAVQHTPDITVQRGQYLSEIAGKDCGNPLDWTGIYDANTKVIGKNPDMIEPGQRLTLSCKTGWAPEPPVAVVTAKVQYHSTYSSSPKTYSAPAEQVSTAGDGSFESCVITRESGGNSQVMNSSGHYGLFQFDYGTWVSGGGRGADFGHASVAEQQAVFDSVYAARGVQPWAPSDDC